MKYKSIMYLTKKKGDIFMENKKDVILLTGAGQSSIIRRIVTPLAIDEFNGPRGDFYKNMFAKCPAGRPGTADEVENVAELIMSEKGAFITGSDFLIDSGATASYYYGKLKPETKE